MDFCKAKDFDFSAATAEGCYAYLDCDVVIIKKYVPSRLETASICLAQDELPGGGIAVYFEKEYFGTLAMRLPEDKTLVPDAFINGDAYCYAVSGTGDEPRYALIAGPFEKGCKIRLDLPKFTHEDSLECSVPENEPIIVEDAVSVGEESVPVDEDSAPVGEESALVNEHCVPAVEDAVPVGEESVLVNEHCVPAVEDSAPVGDSVENFTSESILTEDQSLQIQIETSEDCCILYNDQKSRYLLRLNSYDDTVTFSLSEGYAVAVGDGSLYTGLITFIFRGEQFLGETFKIVNTQANTYRIFDFVVMQAVSDDISASLTNAYSPIVGAFSGEACYILDNSAKTSNALDNSNSASSIAESATHGSEHKASRLGFDAITGYKWGKQGNSETTYFFELENGNYEISASFSAPGSSLAACTVPERERVLFPETTTETSRIAVRITNGFLQLIIRGDADFTALIIRAIDTIASDSGYVQIYPEPVELADEFDGDVELNLPTLEDCEEGELNLPTLEDCKEDELILPTLEHCEEGELILPKLEDCEEGELILPKLEDCEEGEADLPELEDSEEGIDSPVPEAPEEGEINIPVLEDDSEDCTESKLSLSTLEDGKVNVCDLSTADENKFDTFDHAALSNSKKDESGPRITVVSSNHSTAKNLPTGLKNLSPAGRKHVNTTLAAKKSKDTAKKLGVAAGALALAGSIVALFKKDN